MNTLAAIYLKVAKDQQAKADRFAGSADFARSVARRALVKDLAASHTSLSVIERILERTGCAR